MWPRGWKKSLSLSVLKTLEDRGALGDDVLRGGIGVGEDPALREFLIVEILHGHTYVEEWNQRRPLLHYVRIRHIFVYSNHI